MTSFRFLNSWWGKVAVIAIAFGAIFGSYSLIPNQSAKIYGRFVLGPKMVEPRVRHHAIELKDGRVLMVGGFTKPQFLSSTGPVRANVLEVYDPKKNKFYKVGELTTGNKTPQAILLNDGKVLILGDGSKSYSIYTADMKKRLRVGEMPEAVFSTSAILLKDGTVLIVGGSDFGTVKRSFLYNSNLDKFERVEDLFAVRRLAWLFLGKSGNVYILGGGRSEDGVSDRSHPRWEAQRKTVTVYDPKTKKYRLAGSLIDMRFDAQAIELENGKILLTGGRGYGLDTLKTAEIYDMNTENSTRVGNMLTPRRGHMMVKKPDGKILVMGGQESRGFKWKYHKSVSIYDPETMRFTSSDKELVKAIDGGKANFLTKYNRVIVSGGKEALSSKKVNKQSEILNWKARRRE